MNGFNSRLIAAAAFALIAITPTTRAQDQKDEAKPEPPPTVQRERRPPRPERPGGANQFERIAERLKLTEEQKGKLQPIFREEASKLRELRQDTSLTAEERRTKARTIRDEFFGKMKPTLTPEQLDELKKIREQGMGRGQRGSRPGGERGGERRSDPPADSKPE